MKLERAWYIAAMFGFVAIHFIGCSDDPKPTTSSSSSSSSGNGGEGGAAGSGGGSNSSSSGMPPECMTAADCKNHGTADFCGEPSCENGKCLRKGLQAPGTPLPSQLYGDCQEKQCDSSFNITPVAADTDVYDDARFCTTDMCTGGVLTHEPVASGTLCTQFGSQGICDGNGNCVPCIDGMQGCVAPQTCVMNRCVGPNCTNGVKDPGESDVDCGSPMTSQCAPCIEGKNCTNNTQCASGLCVATKCTIPSCIDMVKNGVETGFDCGGPECGKCPADEGCVTANDCQSGVCKAGVCLAPACTDAVQNGDEAGIDCGGACPACPP